MKSVQIALLLALLVPLASTVDARQSQSSSYKSGFSSQKSSPARSGSSFGSFGGRSSAPPPRAPAPSSAGRSFGSFGGGSSSMPERKESAARSSSGSSSAGSIGSFGNATSSAPRQSDSALSRGLNKSAAEANAVRTLESRRRAEQDAMNEAARPVPSGPLPQREGNDAYAGGADHYRGVPTPVVIQQNNGNGGIANVITGFLLARATAPSHARQNGYPAQPGKTANNEPDSQGGSFFMTMLRTFAWLLIVSVIGWTLYFVWKFLRRGKAPSQANYSFER